MEKDQFDITEILYPEEKASDPRFPDTPVYRYLSFEALQELLLSKSIPLVKTKYWEDTYENFLFKSETIVGETSFDFNLHQERIFGSSWTKKCESDPLWRIYSQNKCGVRIRSNIRKLADSIQRRFNKLIAWSACVGEVKYLTLREIVDHFERVPEDEFMAKAGKHFRDSMFMKRPEFEHEQEIRIIVKLMEGHSSGEVISLPIVPSEVIEEITFDPRISDDLQRLFVSKLTLIGFEKIANKSGLYSRDKLRIRFKPSFRKFEISDG